MDTPPLVESPSRKVSVLAYVVSGLSFIPLIGVLFGVGSVAYGIARRREGGILLIVIGSAGILFTVALYGTLFYFGFVQRGGVYDDLKSRLAKGQLTSLVKELEYYRIQNGRYPADLAAIEKKAGESFVFTQEPFSRLDGKTPLQFVYELVNYGDNYYLLSRGPDGIEGTRDDIFPDVTAEESGHIGYRKKPNKAPEPTPTSVTPPAAQEPRRP